MSLISLIKEKMLYTSQKNSVISSNIANVNTPGFKTIELKPFKVDSPFKSSVSLKITNKNHISSTKGTTFSTFYPDDTYIKNDGNNVDLEKELTDMQRNNIQHQEAINIYNKIISLFKMTAGSKQ